MLLKEVINASKARNIHTPPRPAETPLPLDHLWTMLDSEAREQTLTVLRRMVRMQLIPPPAKEVSDDQ
jgi:hypothetical protein